MKKTWEEESRKKICEPSQLPVLVEKRRLENKTIASLNGSFDLMHAGHLHIIYQASLQADKLIVCLNTDCSIRKNKGPSRPLIPFKERLQMVAALYFVDCVTYFAQQTPDTILKIIRPTVHVNGADYGANCIEAPTVRALGATIHIVDLVPGLSTSNIVEKIRQCD